MRYCMFVNPPPTPSTQTSTFSFLKDDITLPKKCNSEQRQFGRAALDKYMNVWIVVYCSSNKRPQYKHIQFVQLFVQVISGSKGQKSKM